MLKVVDAERQPPFVYAKVGSVLTHSF